MQGNKGNGLWFSFGHCHQFLSRDGNRFAEALTTRCQTSQLFRILLSQGLPSSLSPHRFPILFPLFSSCLSSQYYSFHHRSYLLSSPLKASQVLKTKSFPHSITHSFSNSLAPFPCFITKTTNLIPQIIIHPKDVQSMEHPAYFFLSNLISIILVLHLLLSSQCL